LIPEPFGYFTEVVGRAQASRGDVTSSEDDNVLVQGVATDTNTLGFFGYAYYEENRDRHDGTISVESTPGHGARFVVRLPRSVSADR
jgi:ABC-type phosphate transport system substrate-binding protein